MSALPASTLTATRRDTGLKVKPLLRGWFHFVAFYVAVVAGAALVALTPLHGTARVGVAVYAVCLSLMLGLSGFYHWPTWTPPVRRVFKKLDHAGIFFQIAGTYTAFWSLAPPELRSDALLAVMWGAALVGAAVFSVFTDLHRALRSATYVALGVSTLPLAIALPKFLGAGVSMVVLAGALIYGLGAVVYARRWPNPRPRVFGYHEVFHVMVLLAAIAQFWAIAHTHFS
ncbi:MAG: hemolysin III family protein [Archangiaceae bacterium]|nr:hemolysin III family protein [Archangiaceae bacterium]